MALTFDEMVKNTKRKFFKLSIEDLREHVDDNWVKEKIRKYHIRTGLNVTHIKTDIMQNDFVASLFCKNPTRCNLAECLACDILGVERLPQRGKDAVRFDENGNISCQRAVSTSKAADCYFDGTYYTLKYTEGAGGAQDNQMQDVYTFLRNGSKKIQGGNDIGRKLLGGTQARARRGIF